MDASDWLSKGFFALPNFFFFRAAIVPRCGGKNGKTVEEMK